MTGSREGFNDFICIKTFVELYTASAEHCPRSCR